MSTYRTKPTVVQATRFLQHKRPWPDGIEMVYAHGIPEARLDGQPLRHGDWIVSLPGNRAVAIPPDAFERLFDADCTEEAADEKP